MTVLQHRLEEVGCTLDNVVKANGWLATDADFNDFNDAYSTFFPAN